MIAVPTPVLVECTTGDAGAEINRVLSVLKNRGGAALPAPDDGIDALVAAAATMIGAPSVVLTSDPDHLEKLLAQHPEVTILAV